MADEHLDKIVDVDVHHSYEDEAEIAAYLPAEYGDRFLGESSFSVGGRGQGINGGHRGIMGDLRDEYDNDDVMVTVAGSPIEDVQEELLDGYGIDIALLTGSNKFYMPSTLADKEYGTALARAYNDYTIDHWLDVDDRFRYTLMVNHRDPQAAAAEVRRAGDHPAVVAVNMSPSTHTPFGNSTFDPIYEAVEEQGLAVTSHLGGSGGVYGYPPTAAGYPSHYAETRMSRPPQMQAHLASLVFNGTFERFSNFTFVSLEWGWSWIPSFLWQMDMEWEKQQEQYPLERPPSEHIKNRVRFDTQPVEEPETNRHLKTILDWMDGDQILMYGSDFPHWDFDHPKYTLNRIDSASRERIFSTNAAETFALG